MTRRLRILFIAGSRGEKIRYALERRVDLIYDPWVAQTATGLKVWRNRWTRLRQLVDTIRSEEVDLILVDSFRRAGLAAVWLAQRFNLPLVVRPRGGICCEPVEPVLESWWLKRWLFTEYDTRIHWLVLNKAAGIVPVSKHLRNRIIEEAHWMDAGRIRAVHLPVDLDRFRPDIAVETFSDEFQLERDASVILTVTNFNYGKKVAGIHYVLPALVEILRQHPDWIYVIAGGGYLLERVRRSVQDRYHDARILFTGTYKPIEQAFARADIVLHPSFRDTFANPLIEAQASGKPVVANNFGGMPEIVVPGESGYIFDTLDEFAAQMQALVENEDMRRCFGSVGRRYVETRHSPETIGLQFQSAFDHFLTRRGS